MIFLAFIRPNFIQLLAESTSFYLSFSKVYSISPVFHCRQYVRTKSLQTKNGAMHILTAQPDCPVSQELRGVAKCTNTSNTAEASFSSWQMSLHQIALLVTACGQCSVFSCEPCLSVFPESWNDSRVQEFNTWWLIHCGTMQNKVRPI